MVNGLLSKSDSHLVGKVQGESYLFQYNFTIKKLSLMSALIFKICGGLKEILNIFLDCP